MCLGNSFFPERSLALYSNVNTVSHATSIMKSPESLRLPLAAGASSRQHGRRIWHIGAGLFLLVVASFGWSCRKLIPDLRLGDCTRHHPDRWIDQQEETSYRKILSNIGVRAAAKDGLVVASPSKGGSSEPDYFVGSPYSNDAESPDSSTHGREIQH